MSKSTCSHNHEDLVFYAYDELSATERDHVEARLSVCPVCREELASVMELADRIATAPSVDIDDDALQAIRRATSRRIQEEGAQSRYLPGSILNGLLSLVMPRPALAVGVITAGFVLAFFAGRLTVQTVPPEPRDPAMLKVTDVSNISFDEDAGIVQISFASREESTVEGSLSDPHVQSLLSRALLDIENPMTRMRAANVLSDEGMMGVEPDEELVQALTELLAEEENEGIRLQAIQAVRKLYPSMPLPDYLVDTLTEILHEASNSALRIQALKLLTDSEIASMRLAGILEGAQEDPNAYVRNSARKVLEQLEGSMPLESIETDR